MPKTGQVAGGTFPALGEDMKHIILAAIVSASTLFAQSADAQAFSLGEPVLSIEGPSRPLPQPAARRLALGTTLGGLAGVAGGFGLAWGPAYASHRACQTDTAELCGIRTAAIMLGTTWATPATTALGIWAGGRAAGGRGGYGVTLLGSAIGGAAGAGLAVFGASRNSQGAAIAGLLSIPVLQWVGGVIAYHLSHNANVARAERRMMPMVQMEQGGASLQLSGAF